MNTRNKQTLQDQTAQIEELSPEELKTFISDLQARQQELERQKAELQQQLEERARHEDRYKTLFENMNSGVAVYEARDDGQDFIFVDFNRAGERLEHLKKEDLLGKSVLEMFPGIKKFGLFEVFQRVWQTGEPEHFPVSLYQDERIVGWRENYVCKLPSGEVATIYDDATKRKQAEEALRASEEKLQMLFEILPVGISILDQHRNVLMTNPALARILKLPRKGFEQQQYIKRTYLRHDGAPMPPEEFPSMRAYTEQRRIQNVEIGIVTENHETIWTMVSAAPLPFTDWKVVVTTADITDQKRAEGRLQESETRFRLLFDHTFDAIIFMNPHGRIIDVNNTCCELLGYHREALLTLTTKDLHPPEEASKIQRAIEKSLADNKQYVLETILLTKSQEHIPVEAGGVYVKMSGQDYVLKSFRDISERKRMEETRLRELQSLRQLSHPQKAVVTANHIGIDPLHISAPHLFAEFVERQKMLLELALQEQVYKTDQHVAEKLQAFAGQLGFLKAGPRDVVDIHIRALQQKTEKTSVRKSEAYADVGRLILLELMGYLLSYYRNYYSGAR